LRVNALRRRGKGGAHALAVEERGEWNERERQRRDMPAT
jgi:hypothetical protein